MTKSRKYKQRRFRKQSRKVKNRRKRHSKRTRKTRRRRGGIPEPLSPPFISEEITESHNIQQAVDRGQQMARLTAAATAAANEAERRRVRRERLSRAAAELRSRTPAARATP